MVTKSKIAIIEETVDYYSENPEERRGVDSKRGCVYETSDGKQCAVGRCLINPLELENHIKSGYYISASIDELADEITENLGEEEFVSMFKEEYRGHDVLFWSDLQRLHDSICREYWDSEGLTDSGKKYVEELKLKYKEE